MKINFAQNSARHTPARFFHIAVEEIISEKSKERKQIELVCELCAMPSYYVIHSLRIITIIVVSAILSKWIDSRRSGRRIVHNVNDTKLPWKNYLLHFVA